MASIPVVPNKNLRQADPAVVETDLGSIKQYFGAQRWVGPSNTYEFDCINAIIRDTKPGKSLNHGDLREYIAASIPLHCVDGWSFLARAIDAHLSGDFDAARHLAYYAELRAAMSLLAGQGIGVFSLTHFVVNSGGDCKRVQDMGGTHKAIWPILEYWAGQAPAADLVGGTISPGGAALRDWLDAFDTSGTLAPLAARWLKEWGLDLQDLSTDRDSRNEASYRPTRLSKRTGADSKAAVDFIESFWDAHAPSPSSRFDVLDRHLLRASLEAAYLGRFGKTPAADAAGFKARVEAAVDSVRATGGTRDQWVDFLTRAAAPSTHAILERSASSSPVADPRHHLEVASRASLLLRLASGACATSFAANGIARSDLAFWWKAFGEDRGLWEPREEPPDFIELNADVEAAIDDIRLWRQSNGDAFSFSLLWEEMSRQIADLARCERIALWGLGI